MCSNCLFPKVQKQLLKPKSNSILIPKTVNPEGEIHELQSIHTHSPKEMVTLGCEMPEFDLCGILEDLAIRHDRSRHVENEFNSGKGNFSLFNYNCAM
jgi:hypothetical protein